MLFNVNGLVNLFGKTKLKIDVMEMRVFKLVYDNYTLRFMRKKH